MWDWGDTYDLSETTVEQAGMVLHFFGEPNFEVYQAGGFYSSLLRAMSRADVSNQRILTRAYPGLAGAFYRVSKAEAGVEALKALIAEKRDTW